MKTQKYGIIILFVLSLISAGWAEQKKTRGTLRLAVNLVDGSHVIGVPIIKSIPLHTSFGKVDIPWMSIERVKVDGDHETGVVALWNGDILSGVVDLGPLQLETMMGKVKVGLQHVLTIDVYRIGNTLPASLKAGLVLQYSFDQDDQNVATDQSGSGHNGAISGTKRLAIGPRETARLFDGKGDHIDGKVTASALGIGGKQPRTVNLWVMPNESQDTFLFVIGDRSRSLAQFGVKLRSDTGEFDLDCHSVGVSGGTFKPNEWQMVTAVYEAAEIRLYVDGVKVADRSVRLRTRDGDRLYIGSHAGGSSANFNGAIDDVMIWKRALSKEEIRRLHNLLR